MKKGKTVLQKKSLKLELSLNEISLVRHNAGDAYQMALAVEKNYLRFKTSFPWAHPNYRESDALTFIEMSLDAWEKLEMFNYSLFYQQEFVGNMGVHTVKWEHARAEIGYWIKSEFEGRGIMTKACRILLGHLFEHGFNRVEIRCDPENGRSSRIAERLGMVLEGHLHQHVYQDEKFRDTLIYAMLSENFRPN